jgi:hypothetical protein
MPLTITRFGSAIDLKTVSYTSSTLPTTEADAIVLLDTDISTASGTTNPSPNVTSVGGNTQGTLYINFTKNTLTNCILKFYGSYVGNPGSGDWYSESDAADTSGVLTLNQLDITMTASTKMMFHFPIGACRAYKVTVATTGSIGTDTLSLAIGMRSN